MHTYPSLPIYTFEYNTYNHINNYIKRSRNNENKSETKDGSERGSQKHSGNSGERKEGMRMRKRRSYYRLHAQM